VDDPLQKPPPASVITHVEPISFYPLFHQIGSTVTTGDHQGVKIDVSNQFGKSSSTNSIHRDGGGRLYIDVPYSSSSRNVAPNIL
jgi:hypothetical protein